VLAATLAAVHLAAAWVDQGGAAASVHCLRVQLAGALNRRSVRAGIAVAGAVGLVASLAAHRDRARERPASPAQLLDDPGLRLARFGADGIFGLAGWLIVPACVRLLRTL